MSQTRPTRRITRTLRTMVQILLAPIRLLGRILLALVDAIVDALIGLID